MTTDCPYCGDSVPDESYERHLRRNHADELTPIDRRRVGPRSDSTSSRSLVLYASLGSILVLFAFGYALVFLVDDPATDTAAVQPDPTTPVHEHGRITVQYDGTTVDFSEQQYLEADDCFHFHADGDAAESAGDGTRVWHTHCGDVTVEYALATLGMEVTADSATIEGQQFSTADGDEIRVTVDGEPVDPRTYVLDGVEPVDAASDGAGDDVRVVVRSGD